MKRTTFDTLDIEDRPKLDAELAEQVEPLNLRGKDSLELALAEVIKKSPGGYMTNKMFDLPLTAGNSRVQTLTFDRYYWELKLLVDFIQKPTNEFTQADVERNIAEKQALAKKQRLRYLPIIGAATLAEIAAVAA